MRVLLTRPIAQAKRSADRLIALGCQPILAPLSEIHFLLPATLKQQVDAIVATSSHAFELPQYSLDRLRSLPLFVVGARTAEAASAKGLQRAQAIASSAHDLIPQLLAQPPDWTWLYLAGAPRTQDIELCLVQAGRKITLALVYEARAVTELPSVATDALRRREVDAVLHFSPRSADVFVDLSLKAGLGHAATEPLHVAISERAAAPLCGFAKRVRIASTPDEAGMVRELIRRE